MKKIITLILAVMMCFSVVITGCGDNSSVLPEEEVSTSNGLKELDFASASSNEGPLYYEEGVTYSDEIGTYDINAMKETDPVYDKNVFYRNDIVAMTADPHVVYCSDKTDTENYDYYFLFGTTGNAVYNCFKSKDAVSWEPESGAFIWPTGGWEYDCTWAPEVIYDKDADRAKYGIDDEDVYGKGGTGCYFMFTSATVADSYDYLNTSGTGTCFMPIVAVAARPQGPYKQWEGKELGATIAGTDYGTQTGYAKYCTYPSGVTYRGRANNEVTTDDPWWNASAARASLSFQWNNRANAGKWVNASGATRTSAASGYTYVPESAKWMDGDYGKDRVTGIDLTPYVDPISGDKYVFFTRDGNGLTSLLGKENNRTIHYGTNIYMIKTLNNDWAQLDYSTLTRVSRTNYNFVSATAASEYNSQASSFNASAYEDGHKETKTFNIERSTVEQRIMGNTSDTTNSINEGTQMQYNPKTGLYYLTFSMGGYTNNTYTVIQCVAYDIMGPYRKLDVGEGGMLLSTDNGSAADNLTGVGHHTMLELYDEELGREPELVCMYHKHNDLTVSKYERGYCVDRVMWVKNNNGMTVMKVNGPTTYIQPRYYSTGETPYDNLARYDSTTITYNKMSNIVDANHGLDKLNDGIIATVSDKVTTTDSRTPVEPYIHEFQTTYAGTSKITVDLGGYHMVTAFMLYNSREYDKSLRTITYSDGTKWHDVRKVEMSCYKDGKEFKAIFDKIEFYQDFCQFKSTASLKLRAGGAITAVFKEIAVKDITFSVYNFQTSQDSNMSNILAISEIVVLGRPETVNI